MRSKAHGRCRSRRSTPGLDNGLFAGHAVADDVKLPEIDSGELLDEKGSFRDELLRHGGKCMGGTPYRASGGNSKRRLRLRGLERVVPAKPQAARACPLNPRAVFCSPQCPPTTHQPPRLMIDSHLDLSWNALQWNRDLTEPLEQLNDREKQMADRRQRGRATVSLPELRKGGIAVCLATMLARASARSCPAKGSRASTSISPTRISQAPRRKGSLRITNSWSDATRFA